MMHSPAADVTCSISVLKTFWAHPTAHGALPVLARRRHRTQENHVQRSRVDTASSASVAVAAAAVAFAAAEKKKSHTRPLRKHVAITRAATAADMDGAEAAATERFLEWAKTSGIELSPKLSLQASDDALRGPRCVICTAPITTGELLVKLPKDAACTVSMAEDAEVPAEMADLSNWWKKHTRSSVRLAALLAWQEKRFAPYIGMLRPLDSVEAPWLWSDSDLSLVSASVAQRAKARRQALDEAYADLEHAGFGDRVPRELFFNAHHAVTSRAFSGQDSEGAGSGFQAAVGGATLAVACAAAGAVAGLVSIDVAAAGGATAAVACGSVALMSGSREAQMTLLPMIDQVNHASGPPPRLEFDPSQSSWELRADRNYDTGTEILFSYGDKDNDSLLLQHGFIEEGNPFDVVELLVPGSLPSPTQEKFKELNVVRLKFKRGGDVVAIREDGQEAHEVPEDVLAKVAVATLMASDNVRGLSDEADAEIERRLSSSTRAQVVHSWRRERQKLLEKAKKRWL
eukprot:TRINITY_DN12620_c0_g1_i1.p1 TRINITY_DN12620_c0_g1~~TRINITY_DN12620_c0_g1_i1.p1  ORF type:complete len:516 (-),score=107.14 TRINITY_DN12620_c0_g1_i1:90-1637(-)